MSLGFFLDLDTISLGSFWELKVAVNGYESFVGNSLVTQAAVGRKFEIIHIPILKESKSMDCSRIMVRFLEDGYKCWLSVSQIIGNACRNDFWEPIVLSQGQIKDRIPKILEWLKQASNLQNKYLWGGTIGPDFDCSGLVQAAFATQDIWLPRDAYQQEQFCERVEFNIQSFRELLSGDLLFFGTQKRCNHVAIYIGNGFYCHSSGPSNGNNGIGFNSFNQVDIISNYYQSLLRGAGRVQHCHDGSTLI
tara:strand:- start:1134 stop:1880 length:747 start_codon:yes stop_codon:yes gene_type:complete